MLWDAGQPDGYCVCLVQGSDWGTGTGRFSHCSSVFANVFSNNTEHSESVDMFFVLDNSRTVCEYILKWKFWLNATLIAEEGLEKEN